MSNTLTSVNDEISVQLDDNLRRALTHLRSTGLTDEQNIQQAILDTARNLIDATRLSLRIFCQFGNNFHCFINSSNWHEHMIME